MITKKKKKHLHFNLEAEGGLFFFSLCLCLLSRALAPLIRSEFGILQFILLTSILM